MDNDDLLDAFYRSPEKALEFLRQKGADLTISWDNEYFIEYLKKTYNKAFTVAKAMSADVVMDLYMACERYKEEGLKPQEIVQDLEPVLRQKGWWGKKEMKNPKTGEMEVVQLGSESRIKKIIGTNSRISSSQASYEKWMSIVDMYPYGQYIQENRKNKRKSHSRFHNNIYHWKDPIWRSIWPPSDHGCHCKVIFLSAEEAKAQGVAVSDDDLKFIKDNKDDFGMDPLGDWEPDYDKYHPKLRKELKNSIDARKKEKKSA